MTEISSEDSSGSVIYITPLPRIPLALSLDADQSYVDLFDAYARETNLQMIEEDTALDQPRHHYPAVMKSMLGRLEMFGRLANLRDFTQHSKGQKKTKGEDGEENSSEADERFYDLDDGFIDAEYDDSDRENVEDFESAIREGHYTLKPDLFIPFDSRQTSLHPKTSRSRWKDSRIDFNRKRKAKAISSYTPEIQRTLLGLQDLYLAHSGETVAVAYPKGAVKLINDTLCLMLCDPVRTNSDPRSHRCMSDSE